MSAHMLWCDRDGCPGCAEEDVADPVSDELETAVENLGSAMGLLFRLHPELNDDAEEANGPPEARRLRSAISEAEGAVQSALRVLRSRS